MHLHSVFFYLITQHLKGQLKGRSLQQDYEIKQFPKIWEISESAA